MAAGIYGIGNYTWEEHFNTWMKAVTGEALAEVPFDSNQSVPQVPLPRITDSLVVTMSSANLKLQSFFYDMTHSS